MNVSFPNTTALERTQGPSNRADKTAEAAAGMEGLFVSMLLKQMRQTLEPGALFGSDNGDILGGLFDASLGQHVARSEALGIARLLRQQWSAREAPEGTPPGQVDHVVY